MASRHRSKGRHLNRNYNQRKALFKGLLNSLIINEQIKTTKTRAKAIQGIYDQLVSKAKPATVHVRRLLQAFLGNKSAVNKLVDDVTKRSDTRTSGFTRITKLGLRKGDNAQIVKIEIIDKPQAQPETKEIKKITKKAKVTK